MRIKVQYSFCEFKGSTLVVPRSGSRCWRHLILKEVVRKVTSLFFSTLGFLKSSFSIIRMQNFYPNLIPNKINFNSYGKNKANEILFQFSLILFKKKQIKCNSGKSTGCLIAWKVLIHTSIQTYRNEEELEDSPEDMSFHDWFEDKTYDVVKFSICYIVRIVGIYYL